MRLKRNFLACALLVVILAVIANTTLAYYTDAVETHNVITSGGVRVSLVEKDGEGDPWQDVTDVMPGDVVDKIVTVQNEQEAAWVRVWVAIECERAMPNGEMAKMQMNVEDFLGGRGNIVIDFNDTDWTYNERDGHFYYNTALPAYTGEGDMPATEPLFNQVSFDARDMGNDWQNGKLTISITAEAVQAANNPDAAGFACPAKHEVDDRDARPEGGHEDKGEEKREDEPGGEGDTKPADPDAGATPPPPPAGGGAEGPGEEAPDQPVG